VRLLLGPLDVLGGSRKTWKREAETVDGSK